MGYPFPNARGYMTGSPAGVLASRQNYLGAENTGSMTTVAATCYAQYWGRWSIPLTAMDVYTYIHGVAPTVTGYCEIGIATSTAADLYTASVSLTILASASIDTEVKAAATASARKSLTGVSIPAFRDIWVVIAGSYDTTQAQFRTPGAGGGDTRGYARTRAACQPSTNLNTALAFAWTVGAALVVPEMSAEPR